MLKLWLSLVILLMTGPAAATETVEYKQDEPSQIEAPIHHRERDYKGKFEQKQAQTFHVIGTDVEPGTRQNLQWFSPQSPGGFPVPIPVIVVNGCQPGPVLCLTAAIHGDELNGIEIVRQIVHGLNPEKLNGVVVGVPIVNLEGFWRRDRYIGDRRDLNRFFPGSRSGSYPARVAFSLFNDIIQKCDVLLDLHTGSFFRENLPQIRVDLSFSQVADLSKYFGGLAVFNNIAPTGSLRGAATVAGIPAAVMEIGGPLSLETEKVRQGVKSIKTLLYSMGMTDQSSDWIKPKPIYYDSKFIRAESGGILINSAKLGDKVKRGDILAKIIDPVTNEVKQVASSLEGIILGRAQNQFVSPGYALFRIGIIQTLKELEKKSEKEKDAAIERTVEKLDAEKERMK